MTRALEGGVVPEAMTGIGSIDKEPEIESVKDITTADDAPDHIHETTAGIDGELPVRNILIAQDGNEVDHPEGAMGIGVIRRGIETCFTV